MDKSLVAAHVPLNFRYVSNATETVSIKKVFHFNEKNDYRKGYICVMYC